MEDFDIGNIQDEDRVEITDLDSPNDDSSISFSLVLLRLVRKTPLFANTHARFTTLALLACAFMLLFLVQPGLPDVPRRTSRTSALATSHAVDVQSQRFIRSARLVHYITWIRISKGKVVVIQVSTGIIVGHQCKVQHFHPTIVMCI